ncbi:MAG: DUF4492 domain-containing protein [Mediterranea sp.]|jgi:hypothetical protein|nr:DUF4492 domain-containing protein [Mediterranea sp.]
MTLGRTLWLIILLKLFIMFFVLRLFFFPNYLSTHAKDGDKASFVRDELIERALPAAEPVAEPADGIN